MTATLTAQDMLRDGVNLSLVGYTQSEVASARAELVDLASEAEARIAKATAQGEPTERRAVEALTTLSMFLNTYTSGIDAIDRLPR